MFSGGMEETSGIKWINLLALFRESFSLNFRAFFVKIVNGF